MGRKGGMGPFCRPFPGDGGQTGQLPQKSTASALE
jgi:hypothetical protein